MDDSYDKLKSITDEYYAGQRTEWANDAIALLNEYGIKLRQKNGTPEIGTVSIPKSLANAIVIGIRYKKRDMSYTEDTFLFEKEKPIKSLYRDNIEKLLPEYTGTHKKQSDF